LAAVFGFAAAFDFVTGLAAAFDCGPVLAFDFDGFAAGFLVDDFE